MERWFKKGKIIKYAIGWHIHMSSKDEKTNTTET